MKNTKQNSERWLRQAEFDLTEAKRCSRDESYAYCCFFAEQAAQKALKAFLLFQGERFINIHSITKLAEAASKFENEFTEFVNLGKTLDRYYLTTRYPDAVAEPALPYEVYTNKEAEESLQIAGQILDTCKKKIGL